MKNPSAVILLDPGQLNLIPSLLRQTVNNFDIVAVVTSFDDLKPLIASRPVSFVLLSMTVSNGLAGHVLNELALLEPGPLPVFIGSASVNQAENTESPSPVGAPARVAIRHNRKTIFVESSRIEWIESEGNYCAIHAEGKKRLKRITLGELSKRLDPTKFVQVSRSAIVNMTFVKEIQPWFGGKQILLLENGKKLLFSRKFGSQLRRFSAA